MGKFTDIQVGTCAELTHVITERDIAAFVELTGDDNKLHVDKAYSARTAFKKPVAHGMLGASFISTVIGTKLPGDGALWFSQQLDFLLPVRVGDQITVRAEVLRKFENDRFVELRTDIFNQHKQKVTTGVARVKIIEEEQPAPVVTEEAAKVALVVGASGGIGGAVARQLARHGWNLALHSRGNREAVHELQAELEAMGRKAIAVAADISCEKEVSELRDAVLRAFPSVTLVVNCTTLKIPNIKFAALSWEDLQAHIDLNVRGAFHLAQCFVPVMEKAKYGKFINMTTQALETPSAEWTHYITAKAALDGFSKALAVELAPKGIRVNLVSPGMTDTELIADIPEKLRAVTEAKTPLKRLATPDDIAAVVGFLASSGADFITGETIRVNGGQVMR